MSVAVKLHSPEKLTAEARPVLGPAGNRVRVLEESKRKTEVVKKVPVRPKKPATVSQTLPQEVAVRKNLSVESLCSTDSSSSSSASSSRGSSTKVVSSRRNVKRSGLRAVKVVPDDSEEVAVKQEGIVQRCDWITPNSDQLYKLFHNEEWGVPVHEDSKLFELLVFSQALAELNWPAILHLRATFRKLFDGFDPLFIAQFTEKKLLSLKVNGNLLLSEQKLRAIVENAKQVLKIQQEFGSFSSYCWRFVSNKPLKNGFRYARQVPVKTPKAELVSKDLMQRGFRCVGPTVVYSFMQVAGIVNDHLVKCFRYEECNENVKKDIRPRIEETKEAVKVLEKNMLNT
ncbi:hypothetical protein K2173_007293 [Erythroxylum novogranatense]|uniref:DNA-3-methyladenine glycosylase I n=1 Tax=Erythroxylum novogranatense TaxID=1862640 RepID=A0AAV8T5T2_9ROSI|nr:hypothetical protein K2173_007293 [Erythroxylum novogranatense]